MKKPKFTFEFKSSTRKDQKQKHRWRAVSSNGEIICSSETFLHKAGPKKTVNSFIKAIRSGDYEVGK